MLKIILQMILPVAITILKEVLKSPSEVAMEGTVIAEAAQLATQADTMINGASWTYTAPATPAPAAAPAK